MALADFQPITQTIQIKSRGGNIEVVLRGLGLNEIHQLLSSHGADMEGVFRIYEENAGPEITVTAMGKFAMALVKQAPGLVAHAVALSAGEPGAVDAVQKMGILDQIRLVKAVGQLTFEEVGSVKKLIAELADFRNSVVSN